MPKNTNANGPTYEGHVNTALHKSQPEWAPECDVADEVVADKPEDKPKRGRPKGSTNKPKTTAGAESAEGEGASRG